MARRRRNGYVWAVSTPTIRYYEYHHSRSGKVVKELIGENFGGILGSDFLRGLYYPSRDGINGVGSTTYAMCMTSKREYPA